MRVFILSVVFLALVSCEETEEAKTGPVQHGQVLSAPDETVQVVHMQADTNKIILMGRGSEPGWICQFFQTKVRLVYNNGSDSIILRGLDFSNQMRMEKGFEMFRLESPGKDTAFITLPQPCREETNGQEHPMQMQVKVGKQTFNGCAWVPN